MFYKEWNNFVITCITLFYKLLEPKTWFPKKESAPKVTSPPILKDLQESRFYEDKSIRKFLKEFTEDLDNVEWIYHEEFVGAPNDSVVYLCNNYRILWKHEESGYLFLVPK